MWQECLFLLCLWFQKPNVSDPKTLFDAEMASVCLFRVGGGKKLSGMSNFSDRDELLI